MPQKYDLCSMGELLIDFTPQGKSDNGNDLYECNPGGAPANVLVMFSKLGGKAAFIGKVGKDGFGFYLKKVLEQYGINCDGLIMAEERRTNLAFVHLDEKGDRSFSFYRDGGFDLMLKIMREEINPEALKNCGIFHFGSLSLTDSISRSTTYYAIKTARESGSLISFDPYNGLK